MSVADKRAWGDFQTPLPLAGAVAELARRRLGTPAAVVEPTCGRGHFLRASFAAFGPDTRHIGLERNPAYLAEAKSELDTLAGAGHAELRVQDAFGVDWSALLASLPSPVMVLGNPPWVTTSTLGALGRANTPTKRVQAGQKGLDALTGRSNFDVSEWIGCALVDAFRGLTGGLVLLLKTSVARKILRFAWSSETAVADAAMYRLDAQRWFSASVDASALFLQFGAAGAPACALYDDLDDSTPSGQIGLVNGLTLVSSWQGYHDALHELRQLAPPPSPGGTWRSGVKHDCAAVFELEQTPSGLVNGLGHVVDIEPERCFPLLKSTDIARGRLERPRRIVIPQFAVGEATADLSTSAPRTHTYLAAHRARLAARKSRVYRGRPEFSIFGVGPYTFAPWKIAISGLHKSVCFRLVPPRGGRPVLLDDTTYFVGFEAPEPAREALQYLRSSAVHQFLSSQIFWDEKRPITARLLRRLPLGGPTTLTVEEQGAS